MKLFTKELWVTSLCENEEEPLKGIRFWIHTKGFEDKPQWVEVHPAKYGVLPQEILDTLSPPEGVKVRKLVRATPVGGKTKKSAGAIFGK